MNGDAVKAALEALASVLGVTAVAEGAVIRASLVPDVATLDLKNFSPNGLSVPIVAPLRIAGVGKDVNFPTAGIVDGDATDPASRLVADPLPDAADLTDPNVDPTSPMQIVHGLLAGLEGTIPVGSFTPDFVTVSASVCWRVQPSRECMGMLPLEPGESLGTGPMGPDGKPCSALTAGSSVELPIVPPITALKGGADQATCIYHVVADVTLRALGVEHRQQVGPIDVPVPAIALPTVLVVFSEVLFNASKDGGRLVIVPTDVPIQSLQALVDTLGAVSSALSPLTRFVRVVGLLTGLNSVVNALRPVPGSNHKLIFTSLDQTGDLGDVAPDWRHRSFWDDHGAEDDIDSLLMLSVDKRLEIFEDQDFEDTRVDVTPSATQFWVGIPDFHDMTTFSPPDATVTSGQSNFSDEAHSLRFLDV